MGRGRPKGSKNNKVDLSKLSTKDLIVNEESQGHQDKERIEDREEKNNLSPEQKERKLKLTQVMRDLNKSMKGVEINYASSIEKRERLSFGYKSLDTFTGGGLPRGSYTTIWGSKSSGKSSIAYKAIATTQKQGLNAMYLDLERSYDKEWAINLGVDTNSLIYVAVHNAEEAMDVVIKTCKEKVVDLIVVDSLQGMCPKGELVEGKGEKEKSVEQDTMALLARKLSQFFRMATPSVSDAKCAVLLIGQSRMDLGSFIKLETLSGGHALLHNSRLIIKFRRGQGQDAPTEKIELDELNEKGKPKFDEIKIGFDLVARIDKSQISGCVEGQEIHLPFLFENGIKEE